MAFIDVPTTSRRKMTPTRALRIWEAHGGVCVTCRQPIDGVREPWFVEHIRALSLGGEDTDTNCGPAHLACKAAKDADDQARTAEAKREKRVHLGISRALKSRGFPPVEPKRRATKPVEKSLPPRRSLYVPGRP